jgi:membrane protein
VLERLRALPDRYPWLGLVLSIQQRFSELHGSQLAASVTLSAFLSLFPLLLVAIAVIGFFSANAVDLPGQVIEAMGVPADSDAARLIGDTLATAEASRRTASVIGLLGLLWTGLGLVASLEHAYNAVWQVPGRGWKDKLFGLAWLAGAGVLFLASFGMTAVLNFLPGALTPLNLVVGVAISTALFLWASKVLPNRDVGWRPLLPGAVSAAVGLEVLKVLGGIYVPRAVASSSQLYGSIGVVFAVLAWLLFFGRLLVYAAVVNVILWERRHGTVTVEVQVPKIPGEVPLDGTRAGEVAERAPA